MEIKSNHIKIFFDFSLHSLSKFIIIIGIIIVIIVDVIFAQTNNITKFDNQYPIINFIS